MGTLTLRDLSANGTFVLDHHLLTLVTAGHGTHEVDFVSYQCRPSTLVWARPGQLVRFGGQPGLDATLVCWGVDLLAPLHPQAATLDGRLGPTHWQLAGEDEEAVINEVSQLVVDCERHRSGDLPAVLLRHQLAGLLLRIALLPPQASAAGSGGEASAAGSGGEASAAGSGGEPAGHAGDATFRRFRDELEHGYATTRRVDDYAAELGCCVRTLTRASLAATGRSAKQLIDDRVALQAKRLLAGTDLSIAEIGRRLGFPEPTNFGRFFQREVGTSPGGFRLRAAGTHREVQVPAPRRALDAGSPLHHAFARQKA